MKCYLCQREAVDRCFTCGQLFCEVHGQTNCERCAHGFAPGPGRDDRVANDRISARLAAQSARPGWWRPQPAEDYAPPACYQCKGLARMVCRNCQARYCSEHAGRDGWCASCVAQTRWGNAYLILVFAVLGLLVLFSWWQLHGR